MCGSVVGNEIDKVGQLIGGVIVQSAYDEAFQQIQHSEEASQTELGHSTGQNSNVDELVHHPRHNNQSRTYRNVGPITAITKAKYLRTNSDSVAEVCIYFEPPQTSSIDLPN